MLHQHEKQIDNSHELILFGFNRNINSSHMIKHLWILRENQYFHQTKFLCVCTIPALVLCITRTATVPLFYFGLVFHIRTLSNFKSFSGKVVTQIHTLFYTKSFDLFWLTCLISPYSVITLKFQYVCLARKDYFVAGLWCCFCWGIFSENGIKHQQDFSLRNKSKLFGENVMIF